MSIRIHKYHFISFVFLFILLIFSLTTTITQKQLVYAQPVQAQTTSEGDVNNDGKVDIFDLILVAKDFGKKEMGFTADLNSDGRVDILDLVVVAKNFGKKISQLPVGQSESPIKIKGDYDCQTKTQEALSLLQNKAALHYNRIIKYVGSIECAEQGSGMYAWETPPRYQVGKKTYEGGAIWYAGTIAHDACHSRQYHDYRSNHTTSSVPNEIWMGEKAERQCLDVQYEVLQQIGADNTTLEHIQNVIDTKYWEIPYSERWW